MAPRVWIVPVNFNGLDDTRKCLHSLAALSPLSPLGRGVGGEGSGIGHPSPGGEAPPPSPQRGEGKTLSAPASVVVVDNASNEDPTPILKEEFPWAFLVRNPVNTGWSGGNNTGIRFALERGADFIILLNNDTTVHPDLVGRLLAAAEAHPAFGIIGPVIRYMDEPNLTMTDGVIFNRPGYPGFFQRQTVPERHANPPRVDKTDIVNGCCMMVRAAVFESIGLIDDRFFLIHEEADFCLRTREAGWKCGVLAEGLVWHKGSSAFKRSGKRWQRYYDTRNLGLLLSKHPRSQDSRGSLSSYAHYLRYAYHRYCHEREDGQLDAANAVLEGLIDAATRRFGAYESRSRWAVPVLRCLFDAAHSLKPPHNTEPTDARKDLWRSPA